MPFVVNRQDVPAPGFGQGFGQGVSGFTDILLQTLLKEAIGGGLGQVPTGRQVPTRPLLAGPQGAGPLGGETGIQAPSLSQFRGVVPEGAFTPETKLGFSFTGGDAALDRQLKAAKIQAFSNPRNVMRFNTTSGQLEVVGQIGKGDRIIKTEKKSPGELAREAEFEDLDTQIPEGLPDPSNLAEGTRATDTDTKKRYIVQNGAWEVL